MKGAIVAVIAILAVVSLVAQPGHAVSCGQVDAALMPCIGYLTGHGGDSPTPECCAGVKAVKGLAQTTAEKRASCACVKEAAGRYTDLKDAAAKSLPGKCDVEFDIPISRTVDCERIYSDYDM